MTSGNHNCCAFSSCSSPVRPWLFPRRCPDWNEPSSALCHHPRPRPGRRRREACIYQNKRSVHTFRSRPWTSMQLWVLAVLLSVLLGCGKVEAGGVHSHGRMLERKTELLIDTREPPQRVKRDGTLLVDYQGSQLSLPQPFDSTLGNNFTSSSCPAFFNSFLSNKNFTDCLPFSLLLQTSNDFFTATRSPVELLQTLDATCNVSLPQCSALMSSLAQQIQLDDNCGADYQMQNPTVTQAYNGFIAYQPLYHAGCLTDSDGNYCYSNAVTNAVAPSSSWIYYLPLGVALPGGARPSCSTCLKQTMAIFATYAGNDSQPLSEVYSSAAQQLDMTCGPQFVEASVQMTSGGARSGQWNMLVVLVAVVTVWFGFM